MATYTPAQMAGSGVLSTQSFTSGSTVTITITDKPSREVGSAYFTISAPTQDASLPLYFVGSTFVPTNVGGIEVDTAGNHWACVIPSGGGTSSLTWTTAVTIPLGGVYIQGTGHIGVNIDPGNFGFTYSDFSSTEDLSLVGDASVIEDILYLTTAVNAQTGNVYRTNAIRYDRNFSAQWSTFIGGGTGELKADGYCIQWTPTNNTTGSLGGGVGYVSTAINAITFLTYIDDNYTWYKNGVSQGATSVSAGFWRQTLYFWGDYNHSAQTFELYWNTTNSKPGSPNKTFTSFSFDSGLYYMGFGAATGGSNDNHELLSWALMFT
jgi:hypothetical protein